MAWAATGRWRPRDTAGEVVRYCGEPYAVAADVSSSPGRAGRSGWTWYSGSAPWTYRIWLEEVRGLRLRADILIIEPVIPADWPGFEICYGYRSATYEIKVQRDVTFENCVVQLDGKCISNDIVHLADDGLAHHSKCGFPRHKFCCRRVNASVAWQVQ